MLIWNRRSLLRGSAQIVAGAVGCTAAAPFFPLAGGPALASTKTAATAEKWVEDTGRVNTKAVEGLLFLGRFQDPMYFLTSPIQWAPNPGGPSYKPVNVPIGFVTDFASIPPVFWQVLKPDGDYAYAAVIHDFLYWEQTRPRKEADEILKYVMEDFGIKKITMTAIYQAVSWAGQSAWDENKTLKGGGGKRILKKFPDKPTRTWGEWKKRTDVFA